jgi:hypothetical protein
MKVVIIGTMMLSVICGLALAQPAGAPPEPKASITLKDRQALASPTRQGFTHTGGGNIDVAQPAPDTVVITMTGVAVAGPHPVKDSSAALNFQLDQCFEIAIDNPKIKRAKLTLEGRVIGLLRSHKGGGSAQHGPAHAAIRSAGAELLFLDVPSHCVNNGENLSINDRRGPAAVSLVPAEYHVSQTFAVSASHPHSLKLCKAASAEFAPDPALDPLWISYWEPFHGASKKDFGFQVILKVAPDPDSK